MLAPSAGYGAGYDEPIEVVDRVMRDLIYLQNESEIHEWNQLVDDSPYSDVYYTAAYARACQGKEAGVAGLLVRGGDRRFLLPLVFRRLSDVLFAGEISGMDAITPYGYGGILPLDPSPVSPDEGRALIANVQDWCTSEGVPSLFIRLHPLYGQHEWLSTVPSDTIQMQCSGATKTVELADWDEAQGVPQGMLKGRRDKLRWARRKLSLQLHTCDQPSSKDALREFMEIYRTTMQRQQAPAFYHFPEAYYQELAEGLKDRMAIVSAMADGETVASALFFAGKHYAHYHLSGTTEEGRRLHAAAVVIVQAAEWARRRGCVKMHLGGGLAPNDSLFQFKESFGGETLQFHSLRVIGDKDKYDRLLHQRLEYNQDPPRHGFFPEYRA
jgi:hypothetical protein